VTNSTHWAYASELLSKQRVREHTRLRARLRARTPRNGRQLAALLVAPGYEDGLRMQVTNSTHWAYASELLSKQRVREHTRLRARLQARTPLDGHVLASCSAHRGYKSMPGCTPARTARTSLNGPVS
jgi:hypothetical protein